MDKQKQVSQLTDDQLSHELKVVTLALRGVPFVPAYLSNRRIELLDEQRVRRGESVE